MINYSSPEVAGLLGAMESPQDGNINETLQKSFQITRHTKEPISVIDILKIQDNHPEIWDAINEIPSEILIPRSNGIYLQRSVYLGLKKRGPKYIDWRIDQDKIAISHKAMTILRLVATYQKFITWDRLFEYLRDHHWGNLAPDWSDLATYPKQANEEPREKPREQKQIEEVEVLFYATQNKLSNSEAYKHFQSLGYQIMPFKKTNR